MQFQFRVIEIIAIPQVKPNNDLVNCEANQAGDDLFKNQEPDLVHAGVRDEDPVGHACTDNDTGRRQELPVPRCSNFFSRHVRLRQDLLLANHSEAVDCLDVLGRN